jgi:hypothetical protein
VSFRVKITEGKSRNLATEDSANDDLVLLCIVAAQSLQIKSVV